MKNKCLFLLFVLLLQFAEGQTFLTIRGQIIDSVSGDPIPYCNCYLKHSQKGSISNEKGVFIIKIEKNLLPDTLVISNIGYSKVKLLKTTNNYKHHSIIKMHPNVQNLNTVEIHAAATNWNKFVENTMSVRLQNYYTQKNIANVYLKHSEDYIDNSKVEAAIEIFTPTINKPHFSGLFKSKIQEEFFIKALRVSKNGKIIEHPELQRNPYGIFDYNIVSLMLSENTYSYKNTLFETLIKKTQFKLKKLDTIDSEIFYTLEGSVYKHNGVYEIQCSIGNKSKAILSVTISSYFENDDEVSENIWKFIYRKQNDKIVPSYFLYYDNTDYPIKNEVFTTKTEILFYDRQPFFDSIYKKNAEQKHSFEFQNIKYDKNFWDNYTIIE